MTDLATAAKRLLLSGNGAVALAALDYGIALGTGYPDTTDRSQKLRFVDLTSEIA